MSHAIRPFEYIETLAQYANRYCADLPEKHASDVQWDGMGFTLGGYSFVVSLNEISKVLPVPRITPLPGVKCWAKGIANIQSRLIPVVDLSEFTQMPVANSHEPLSITRGPLTPNHEHRKDSGGSSFTIKEKHFALPSNIQHQRIITIERRDISVALIVDEVQGVLHFPSDRYKKELPETLPQHLRSFALGCYQQDMEYIVFGIEQLINNKQFLTAAID